MKRMKALIDTVLGTSIDFGSVGVWADATSDQMIDTGEFHADVRMCLGYFSPDAPIPPILESNSTWIA